MLKNYSSYSNIRQECIQAFEMLWLEKVEGLPAIVTNIQTEDNIKAAVFNIWLNYFSDCKENLFLKTDRMFLHAFDERLILRVNTFLWKNVALEKLFHENMQNQSLVFSFSYFYTFEIVKLLEAFTQQHPCLKDKDLSQYPYYVWSDNDIEQNNEIYLIMKYLNADFINHFLSEGRIKAMSIRIHEALRNEGYTV